MPTNPPATSSQESTTWPVVLMVGGFVSLLALIITPLASVLAVVVAIASGMMLRTSDLPKDRSRLKAALGVSGSAVVLFGVLMVFLVAV
ncbi:MAG: hypothetical protein ACTH1D_03220 [Mycobacteriaceae bacterium]|uniref:hypothetical protein n=1 Tax=Corynebacterium sp. TaxID=1720 RepID=UPI003F9A91A8